VSIGFFGPKTPVFGVKVNCVRESFKTPTFGVSGRLDSLGYPDRAG
jgi:hypothetical protein